MGRLAKNMILNIVLDFFRQIITALAITALLWFIFGVLASMKLDFIEIFRVMYLICFGFAAVCSILGFFIALYVIKQKATKYGCSFDDMVEAEMSFKFRHKVEKEKPGTVVANGTELDETQKSQGIMTFSNWLGMQRGISNLAKSLAKSLSKIF